ncbi:MAG: hypothetical protein JSW24_04910 [Dehalococcoidia bacterium]|jgi:hypothetical protein|nr:MAG: hypothetical protein JSW24_04910 [Dehalococcoidia bacterium]
MKNTAAIKLRQVPQGYLVIGVDPHKKKHAAVAITQDFTTHAKFKFSNTIVATFSGLLAILALATNIPYFRRVFLASNSKSFTGNFLSTS